jgi:NADPH:quinone reductase-like Zn-dependent oxidoreductase
MAAQAGARVIAAARPAEHERCRQAGAAVTVDFAEDGLVERVTEHAPEGVAVVWDCGGHLPLEVASEIVAEGGRILTTAAPSARVDVPLWRLYTRDVSVIGFVISGATDQPDARRRNPDGTDRRPAAVGPDGRRPRADGGWRRPRPADRASC